ncbi:hypothetical protein ACIGEZ_31920 [Streptomyces sp. NPDC085481]|uniref:hypothetical protein n=1 Tax=Streptomyces sp. NPDC085481 TaxID=3365727 RepID=UPI0037CF01A3
MGVYPFPVCEYVGAYYRAYYSAKGYRVYSNCVYMGGYWPVQQFLLRVTLAY